MSDTNPAPTPRTDAEMFHAAPEHGAHVSNIPPAMLVTSADFARTIERELTSAQAALAAKDAEIARLRNSQEVERHLGSFRADEELKARAERAEAELAKWHELFGADVDKIMKLGLWMFIEAELVRLHADAEALKTERDQLRAEVERLKGK